MEMVSATPPSYMKYIVHEANKISKNDNNSKITFI